MESNIKKKITVILLFLFLVTALYAQEILPPEITDDTSAINTVTDIAADKTLTRAQVLLYGGVPYASTLLMVLANGFIPAPYGEYTAMGLTLAGMIPHCIIDPLAGFTQTGIGLGMLAGGILLNSAPDLYGDFTLSGSFINISLKTCMWSFYEGYAKARMLAGPGYYSAEYTPARFSELFLAPWDITTISRLSVWLPVLAFIAFDVGTSFLATGGQTAVWETGKAYIGRYEVPVLLGLISTLTVNIVSHTFTGIGEEAVCRGIGYEEMKISIGVIPAKIADALIFSAIHIPQEVKANLSLSDILINEAIRSVITLGLQWAYDEGGLKAATAEHMWIDVFAGALNYLFYSGVAPETPLSINIGWSIKL